MMATMTDVAAPEKPARPGLLKPLLFGALAAAALGGGGWFAMHSGLLGGGFAMQGESSTTDLAFVAVPPMIISLGPTARHEHLRFGATLEVARARASAVEMLMPRVVDVLNGYLRAIDVAAFEEPAALFRLRAQMLRRVQIVTGEGSVQDLLITEFVFN